MVDGSGGDAEVPTRTPLLVLARAVSRLAGSTHSHLLDLPYHRFLARTAFGVEAADGEALLQLGW